MTTIPLAITTICYAFTAWGFYKQQQHGLAIAFVFYACSNLGFIVAGWNTR